MKAVAPRARLVRKGRQSEPADENPLKAEFHLSEGDFCGFFLLTLPTGLTTKAIRSIIDDNIDGKPAAGMWVVPDENRLRRFL
ncbi:MAG: hypothetical protein CM15mP49_07400 [Actinomycetota bacterium]|nr:MAG: hypothetical protein CM15mP49_07400 [Actinomycetota bacterium]